MSREFDKKAVLVIKCKRDVSNNYDDSFREELVVPKHALSYRLLLYKWLQTAKRLI